MPRTLPGPISHPFLKAVFFLAVGRDGTVGGLQSCGVGDGYVRAGGAAGLPGGRGLLCEEERRKVVAGVKVGAPSPSPVVVVLGALCSKLLGMGLS